MNFYNRQINNTSKI